MLCSNVCRHHQPLLLPRHCCAIISSTRVQQHISDIFRFHTTRKKIDKTTIRHPNRNNKTIAYFDVDGTLTPARKEVSQEVLDAIAALRQKIVVGTVGGSDLPKQKEQLGDDVHDNFDYVFAENGLTAFKGKSRLGQTHFKAYG